MEIRPYLNWPGSFYQNLPSIINFDYLLSLQDREKNYSLSEMTYILEHPKSITLQSKINEPEQKLLQQVNL